MSTIRIEEDLYNRLETRANEFGFESADEYAGQILAAMLTELEGEGDTAETVSDRLEDLGYL